MAIYTHISTDTPLLLSNIQKAGQWPREKETTYDLCYAYDGRPSKHIVELETPKHNNVELWKKLIEHRPIDDDRIKMPLLVFLSNN